MPGLVFVQGALMAASTVKAKPEVEGKQKII
jgi:hypothetical protein